MEKQLNIQKKLTRLLRYDLKKLNLPYDKQGWVNIDDLMKIDSFISKNHISKELATIRAF